MMDLRFAKGYGWLGGSFAFRFWRRWVGVACWWFAVPAWGVAAGPCGAFVSNGSWCFVSPFLSSAGFVFGVVRTRRRGDVFEFIFDISTDVV